MQQEHRGLHWWPTGGVMLGALAVSLSQGSLNVAVPNMMSSLGTDLDRIQWVQTGYQIIQAVLIPADKRTARRARLGYAHPLIAGSTLCGLAWNIQSLIVFRILQGIGAGPITPLGMSILYNTFPPDKRGLALGLYNFSFSFGPAIAPSLGGHLVEVLNWRAIFYINVPVGLLSVGIVLLTMANPPAERARSFDAMGVFTLASFLILSLLAVSEGRRYGWGSQMIVMLFIASGVSVVAFIVAELKTMQPFVEIRLYKNLPFAMGCLIALLSTMEFRGTNFLLPIMLQRIYHYTPFQTGLFFLPPALVMGTTSIIAGRLSDKIQPKLLLLIGLVVLSYVSFQFCSLDAWATTGLILGLIVLRRGAQAFCHSPLTSSTLRGVPEDQIRMASGLFNVHRTLGGAVGVALTATLMDFREDVHTLILSQRQALYPLGTEVATAAIRGALMQDGEPGGMLAQKTAGILRQQLADEAALAGYHDLFFMFAALTLFSLLPVMLLRGSKPVLPVKGSK
jgi:EmrB/QacA subfamily drug resistance transporter